MSSYTQPFLLGPSGAATLLERLPLANGTDGQISERWLQDALFRHPEALPVEEIDPHVGPLVPVCMEIETGSGPADLLYVTPSGQIVLVETKLWRNPEARRAVVAQILDYAKNLTTWTYDVLEEKARLAAGASKGYLLQCLRNRFPRADEAEFVDGVGRSLSSGDFLLIIVGDGIRYGAESLVAFLERYGHLRFGLGLVEVAIYRLPSGERLLQPRVLAKTEILQKTVLVGPSGPVSLQAAAQAEDAETPNSSQREWFVSFWGEFLAKLKLDDESLLPAEPARSTNQFFQMPPGGGMTWISAYIAQSTGRGGVYLTFAKAYERAAEIADLLEADRESIERELGASLTWERLKDKIYIGAPNVLFRDLNDEADRRRVVEYLAQMTARMIRVLKPRLEAATRTAN
jgi:hypothetical protein